MAQRNPMNERYQGDGPEGKTRKSASKAKPKTEAASSVHIDKKPATKQERKAASKKRDAQIASKEAERKRKAEEREKQARLAAGEEVEEPKPAGMLDKVKGIFIGPPKTNQPAAPRLKGPDTAEYHRLKRIYWVLMGIGVVAIVASFIFNFSTPEFLEGWGMMLPMGVAYVAVIGAIILDYTKIRKMQKAHAASSEAGRNSPKQLKHQQQKAEAAALLEESKKAQKNLKKANSKLPFMRGTKETTSASATDEDTPSKGTPDADNASSATPDEREE